MFPLAVKFSLLKFKPFIVNSINSLLIVPYPQGLVVAGGVVGVVVFCVQAVANNTQLNKNNIIFETKNN